MDTQPPVGTQTRCAVHPGRPALDDCPTCGLRRCARDAADHPGGCASCRGVTRAEGRRVPPPAESVVRAGLAAFAAALVGAWVASQYVQTQVFSILIPGLVGIGCGAAAVLAGRPGRRPRVLLAVRLLAVLYAVVATGLSFRFVVGRLSPFTPAGRVVPPYLAAAVAAWLWTMPVRARTPGGSSGRRVRVASSRRARGPRSPSSPAGS